MRAVIQRVTRASVTIDGTLKSEIGTGFLVLLGIEDADTDEDLVWLSGKIARLRVFSDENDLMNLSLDDVHGDVLLVSQFTLFASTKKGNRPSYIRAARPEKAVPMYEAFIRQLQSEIQGKVVTGEFGADMKVDLLNDG
ncbi:MAG: D-tyrosyl-tRNA(Tyr) deacylase, partial [Bacteroidales bacterium]|nr:D-tyrosyl-tRNA(Tyr) deacylase [Bacteroidales bacterium]